MVLGHFLHGVRGQRFFSRCVCLLIGVGCFKGNIAAQVGDLYATRRSTPRRAFPDLLLGIQIAVIVSPLVCGTLGQKLAGTGASAPPASAC